MVQQNPVVEAIGAFANIASAILGNQQQQQQQPTLKLLSKASSSPTSSSHSTQLALQDGKRSEPAQHVQAPAQPASTQPADNGKAAAVPLKNDNDIAEVKTHEDFENEALQKLLDRKDKSDARGRGLKRPASAKAKPSDKATTVMAKSNAKSKAKSTSNPVLQLGCMKCRGTKTGCSQCQNPAFTGQRCSREQWLSLAKLQGLK